MKKGFALIEILVTIAIIGTLAGIILTSLSGSRDAARDAKRKSELAQIGRLLTLSCYTPDAGPGDYDLALVIAELRAKNPTFASQFSNVPKDPKLGTDAQTYYHYITNGSGQCALYANLEKSSERVTLPSITAGTAGGGTGVFAAPSAGWNGSNKYFQVSN